MFDASVTHAAHPLMQDRSFAAALRLCGERPITLPSGLLLLNRKALGIPLLMLPRAAPPCDLHVQLAHAGLSHRPLLLSPEQDCPMPRALRISAPRKLLVLNITPDEGAQRAALHQKWRNQLCRAENHALRVLHRCLKPDDPLIKLEAQQARVRRYQNWPAPLTAAFAEAAPKQTHLFTALLRGNPLAQMLFLSHGSAATYHIGHTTAEGRNTYAHNLLLWTAMRHFRRIGIASMHLGPETTPQIDRFKQRAGALACLTGGTWLRWSPLSQR